MKHLIIFAHPDSEKSFNAAILQKVVATSQKHGIDTQVRDLYRLGFNPILSAEELVGSKNAEVPEDIKQEQQLIDSADLITLIYPLWWMGYPAILKGYLDRILSHGFAYKTENGKSVGLLFGKKMQQFITIGNKEEKYQALGFDQSLRDCLVDGLFNFCGIEDIQYQLLGNIHGLSYEERQTLLDKVESQTEQNIISLMEQ